MTTGVKTKRTRNVGNNRFRLRLSLGPLDVLLWSELVFELCSSFWLKDNNCNSTSESLKWIVGYRKFIERRGITLRIR